MMARPASDCRSSGSSERISRQLAVTLTAITFSKTFGSRWAIGEMTPSIAGIGEEHVELAPALVNRAAQPVDAGAVLEVERHQRRRRRAALICVVELLEPADGARDRDDMRAGRGKRRRRRTADAARCAGDDGDAAGKRGRLATSLGSAMAPPSASSDSVRTSSPPSVGQPGRIVAGEAGVAELRLRRRCGPSSPTAR